MRFSLLSLTATAVLVPQTYAWGAVGHEIVATVAQMHLHPSVMPKLCDILDLTGSKCHLAPIAAWADQIRQQPKYRWTAPLHYIGAADDFPSATCVFPGVQGWSGRTHINVLNAIRNTTTVLQEFEGPRRAEPHLDLARDDIPDYVQDAVRFLVHFVGDMHQPLHLTGRHRGGNGDKVAFNGRTTNLHSVWDSLLIAERLRTIPKMYTRPLPLPDVEAHLRDTIYDPYIRRLVWEGVLGTWKDELDEWMLCPPAEASVIRESASTWQTVLALFSPSRRGRNQADESDGGLGVDDDKLCPYAWAKPIHQLNCDVVFPKELDEVAPSPEESAWHSGEALEDEDVYDALRSKYMELDTPEYAGMIKERWIIEKLLTQGGIRLAAVLNWIFAEPGEDALKPSYLTM